MAGACRTKPVATRGIPFDLEVKTYAPAITEQIYDSMTLTIRALFAEDMPRIA